MSQQAITFDLIGDSQIIENDIPILGLASITGYVDNTTGETVTRYFDKYYQYTLDGLNWVDWQELTDISLQQIIIKPNHVFRIKYKYTRAGSDNTGQLVLNSITLNGTWQDQGVPSSYPRFPLEKFKEYFSIETINWAMNVLDKLYAQGIVAKYVDRSDNTSWSDEDFIDFFFTICYIVSLKVQTARKFEEVLFDKNLLYKYLKGRGLFLRSERSLDELTKLANNFYDEIRQRGSLQIVTPSGTNNRVVDGELLRLINWKDYVEFIFGLVDLERASFCIDKCSPLYLGTSNITNIIKGYEKTIGVELLSAYPLIEQDYISKSDDIIGIKTEKLLSISNLPAGLSSGIGCSTMKLDILNIAYTNVSTAKLYEYNGSLVRMFAAYEIPNVGVLLGTFNRINGQVNYVLGYQESDVPSDDFRIAIYNDSFVETSNVLAVTGQLGPFKFNWALAALAGGDPAYIAVSFGYQDWVFDGSTATQASFGTSIPMQDSVLEDIDGGGLASPYQIGVSGNVVEAFVLGGLLVYNRNLSAVTSEALTDVFSQVKYDGVSDYTTYVYIVGENGTLLRVANTSALIGGIDDVAAAIDNIVAISHGLTTEDLKRVWFVNENIGFVFGDNYTILKTVDAGITWKKVNILAPSNSVYGTTIYDGMVVQNGSKFEFYFKVLNSSTSEYDIIKTIEYDTEYSIIIDPSISYEITFELAVDDITTDVDFGVCGFGRYGNPINFESIKDGSTTNLFFEKGNLLQANRFYKVRGIIFGSNTDEINTIIPNEGVTNIGIGNNLRFKPAHNKIVPYLVLNNTMFTVNSGLIEIYNFKIRPLSTEFGRCFIQNNSIILSWMKNLNKETSDVGIEDNMKEYLLPYNVSLLNTWL